LLKLSYKLLSCTLFYIYVAAAFILNLALPYKDTPVRTVLLLGNMVSGLTFHILDPHAEALQFGPRNIENVLRNLHLEHERREHEAATSYFGLSCGALEGSYLGFASQLNPTYPAKTPISGGR
jgi:hypothetical protein